MPNNFNFESFLISSIDFKINDKLDDKSKAYIKPQIKVYHEIKGIEGMVTIVLKIDGEIPFHIEIEGSGLFSFSKEYINSKDRNMERVLEINCASIVFPFLRETIADLTRRSGFPPLMLNPVNFVALYEDKQINTKEIQKQIHPSDVVKIFRNNLGLTQEQLANKIGLSRNHISSIERNKKEITQDIAKKLSKLFKTSIDKFI
ncbi:MAG: helix-turn-helix domain-containing protein [Desulfobacterales bacterium]|nr:helix-turn-helix domain-containing protein [Desulfobacterales bacterium]